MLGIKPIGAAFMLAHSNRKFDPVMALACAAGICFFKLILDQFVRGGRTGKEWWARQDLNPRPNRYERSALTN